MLRFADAINRDHALVLGGVEDGHTLGGAAGHADAADRNPDHLAAIGNHHDLVAAFNREGRNHWTDLGSLGGVGGADALAAAARDAELVS